MLHCKELRASQKGHDEGSVLCTAVKILTDKTGLAIDASKCLLFLMVREWKTVHDQMVSRIIAQGCSPAVEKCMKGLEYQMSGNEQ